MQRLLLDFPKHLISCNKGSVMSCCTHFLPAEEKEWSLFKNDGGASCAINEVSIRSCDCHHDWCACVAKKQPRSWNKRNIASSDWHRSWCHFPPIKLVRRICVPWDAPSETS